MQSRPRPFDLTDYFRIIRKRSGIVVLIVLSAIITGMVFSTFAPKRYKATSTVMVATTPSQVIFWGPGSGNQRMPTRISLETQARLVTTTAVAEKAAQWLRDPEKCDEPIPGVSPHEIVRTLSVNTQPPDLVIISSTTVEDPNKAKLYALAAAEGLVAYSKENATEEVALARQFLQEQVENARKELDAKMRTLAKYQERSGVVDARTETQDIITGLSTFEQARDEAIANAREHESLAAALRQRLAREKPMLPSKALVDNPEYDQLQRELARKQVALIEALSKYTSNHPMVVNLQADVNALKSALQKFESPMVERETLRDNPLFQELQSRIVEEQVAAAGARARLAALDKAVERQLARKKRLPKEQLELGMLEEELEVARETYRSLLQRLKQVEVEQASKRSPARVVDRPAMGANVSLSPRATLVFSFVLGVIIAIGVVLVLEFTDTAIRDADDITRETGIPVLGIIPFRREGYAGLIIQQDEPSANDIYKGRHYAAHAGEAYRTLRSNIKFVTTDEPVQTLLITSAGVGEGKSVTAANLAIVMAQAGHTVLLVDTDLRRPRLYAYFNVGERDTPGLTAGLGGYRTLDEVMLTPDKERLPTLRLVTSGAIPPNPAELLASDQMSELLVQMKQKADYVILDSPPAMMLTDAAVLAARVDGVILLVEAGKVPKAVFADMCGVIQRARGRIIGAVINKRKYQAGDYYYYYYYYEDTGAPTSPPVEDSKGHADNQAE